MDRKESVIEDTPLCGYWMMFLTNTTTMMPTMWISHANFDLSIGISDSLDTPVITNPPIVATLRMKVAGIGSQNKAK